MPEFRYSQHCPLARAVEIIGERWTLLIIRELLISDKRFSDLQRILSGVSSSVLSERLNRLEERGVVARKELPPPAASMVYELTETGRGLLPVVIELARWGLRFLGPPQPNDNIEPGWLRLGFLILARKRSTPKYRFRVTIPEAKPPLSLLVTGGDQGTVISEAGSEVEAVDAFLQAEIFTLLGLAGGHLSMDRALASGALSATGEREILHQFPKLFEFPKAPSLGD